MRKFWQKTGLRGDITIHRQPKYRSYQIPPVIHCPICINRRSGWSGPISSRLFPLILLIFSCYAVISHPGTFTVFPCCKTSESCHEIPRVSVPNVRILRICRKSNNLTISALNESQHFYYEKPAYNLCTILIRLPMGKDSLPNASRLAGRGAYKVPRNVQCISKAGFL